MPVAWFAASLIAASNAARAAEPVAIVEEASGAATTSAMDMLEPGRTIELAEAGHLVIGYLRSCWREMIDGGRVTIGVEKSEVVGGRVLRELVECDGGRLALGEEHTAESGVMVFRRAPGDSANLPSIGTLHSMTPVIRLPEGVTALQLERLDRAETARRIEAGATMVDFAVLGISLVPGGHYRLSAGERAVEVMVDPLAVEAGGPLIGRLISLGP
jgi:hypothetical protein